MLYVQTSPYFMVYSQVNHFCCSQAELLLIWPKYTQYTLIIILLAVFLIISRKVKSRQHYNLYISIAIICISMYNKHKFTETLVHVIYKTHLNCPTLFV